MGSTARVMPAPGKPLKVFALDRAMSEQIADGEAGDSAFMSDPKQPGTAASAPLHVEAWAPPSRWSRRRPWRCRTRRARIGAGSKQYPGPLQSSIQNNVCNCAAIGSRVLPGPSRPVPTVWRRDRPAPSGWVSRAWVSRAWVSRPPLRTSSLRGLPQPHPMGPRRTAERLRGASGALAPPCQNQQAQDRRQRQSRRQ